jgi:hypothetical protein
MIFRLIRAFQASVTTGEFVSQLLAPLRGADPQQTLKSGFRRRRGAKVTRGLPRSSLTAIVILNI